RTGWRHPRAGADAADDSPRLAATRTLAGREPFPVGHTGGLDMGRPATGRIDLSPAGGRRAAAECRRNGGRKHWRARPGRWRGRLPGAQVVAAGRLETAPALESLLARPGSAGQGFRRPGRARTLARSGVARRRSRGATLPALPRGDRTVRPAAAVRLTTRRPADRSRWRAAPSRRVPAGAGAVRPADRDGAMSARPGLPRNGLIWLLVAQVLVILPHLGHLPLWITA